MKGKRMRKRQTMVQKIFGSMKMEKLTNIINLQMETMLLMMIDIML